MIPKKRFRISGKNLYTEWKYISGNLDMRFSIPPIDNLRHTIQYQYTFQNMILIIRLHECHQEPPHLIPDNFVALKLFFMYIPHLFSIKKSFENVSTNHTATCKHHSSRRVPGCFFMEPERRPDGRQFFIFRTNTVRR